MQYTTLGETGLIVSRLTFGAMMFGTKEVVPGFRPSVGQQEEANEMVSRAIEGGINFFDTADMYAAGQSEEILGRAIGDRRDDVVLATKVANRMGEAPTSAGLSRKHVISACEASLRRLGTDYVDLYQAHITDPFTPVEETLEALDDLVRQGKARYVGYSNWPAWMASKAVTVQKERGLARFVSAQVYYSLLGRDIEHEQVPFLTDTGVGTMIWSPLAGGFLSGKYTREDPTGGGGRLADFSYPPMDRELGYDVVDELRSIADARGVTPAQVSLAWLLTKPHVSTVLVGASRMDQLEGNIAATDLDLSEDEVSALDELTAPPTIYPNWVVSGDPATEEMLRNDRSAASQTGVQ